MPLVVLKWYWPVALDVLASEGAHNVGLGVPELGLCKGLTELLRAFKSEFGVVEVFRDKVVGPKRPVINEYKVNMHTFKILKYRWHQYCHLQCTLI